MLKNSFNTASRTTHYAAVIMGAKDKVSFMIFNAIELTEIKGYFKSMPAPDRKTTTITEGLAVGYQQSGDFLKQASKSL